MELNRIYSFNFDSDIEIDKAEAIRYLGATTDGISEIEDELIDDCIKEVRDIMLPKACFVIKQATFAGTGFVGIGDSYIWQSCDLYNRLNSSKYIILFAATIGTQIDRIMLKYSYFSPARSAIIQAVSAAAIEAVCDKLCDKLSDYAAGFNMKLTDRFSAGYGDFDLSCQQDIFDMLNCSKNIGVSLTNSMQMTPSKSVTAIIGMTNSKNAHDLGQNLCGKKSCKGCGKTDCQFRRNK